MAAFGIEGNGGCLGLLPGDGISNLGMAAGKGSLVMDGQTGHGMNHFWDPVVVRPLYRQDLFGPRGRAPARISGNDMNYERL